jgi:hypothetical protein
VVLVHLVAMAAVHVVLLPDAGRTGEPGDLALRHWVAANAVTAAVAAVVFAVVCVRVESGANRWIAPPRRSGWLPVPDPATGCLGAVIAIVGFSTATLIGVLAASGPEDAFLLTGFSLVLQLAGTVVALGVLLWAVMPGVALVVGTTRRGPTGDAGGPTGPLLIASGLAAYAGLFLAATITARLLDVPVGWWVPVVLVVVLVATLVVRIVLGRRARPSRAVVDSAARHL